MANVPSGWKLEHVVPRLLARCATRPPSNASKRAERSSSRGELSATDRSSCGSSLRGSCWSWWAGQGSNLRRSLCKSDALPLSYPPVRSDAAWREREAVTFRRSPSRYRGDRRSAGRRGRAGGSRAQRSARPRWRDAARVVDCARVDARVDCARDQMLGIARRAAARRCRASAPGVELGSGASQVVDVGAVQRQAACGRGCSRTTPALRS